MTPLERRMFKEAVIREHKLQMEKEKSKSLHTFHHFAKRLKLTLPINITLGIIASAVLVYIDGWSKFFRLLLTGIVWITIISAALAAFARKKRN